MGGLGVAQSSSGDTGHGVVHVVHLLLLCQPSRGPDLSRGSAIPIGIGISTDTGVATSEDIGMDAVVVGTGIVQTLHVVVHTAVDVDPHHLGER